MRVPKKKYIAISLFCIFSTTYSVIFIIYSLSPSWEYSIPGRSLSLAIASNENYVATSSGGELVYLFHSSSPTPIRIFNTSDDIDNVDISHDGRYIVAGGDYRLFLYDVISNSILWTYDAQNYIIELMISGDGNYIVIVDIDDMIYVFHRLNPFPIWNRTYSNIQSIDINYDGSLFLVGGLEISLFNSSLSTPLWVYNASMNSYNCEITEDGKYACAGTRSYPGYPTIHIFQTNRSIPIWNYTIMDPLTSIDITNNGKYLIAGDIGGNLRLFDRNFENPIFSYKIDPRVRKLSISEDGNYFASGSSSGVLLFFKRGHPSPLWSYPIQYSLLAMEISPEGNFICVNVQNYDGWSPNPNKILIINKNTPYIFGDSSMLNILIWASIGLITISVASYYYLKRRFQL